MGWSTEDFADLDAFTDEYVLARLAELAGDGTPSARAAAAIALGPALEWAFDELGDDDLSDQVVERARAALRALHDDPDEAEEVRRKALEAAVRFPELWQEEATRRALERGGAWRLTGVFCAGYLGGFDDDIRAAARSDDPELVVEGLRAAASREGFEDLGRIAARLAGDPDTSRDLRLEVVALLGLLRDDRGQIFEVLDELTTDPDEELAEIASEALSEYLMWEGHEDEVDDF